MWIFFALTSAIILASRKIHEKKLVGEIGNALGWMIRLGSAIAAIILWILFSRDFSGTTHPTVLYVLLYCAFAYPVLMYIYYRAIHELPLALFGMMAPIAPLTALIASHFIFSSKINTYGLIGIGLIGCALFILFYKPSKFDSIKLTSIVLGVIAYILMGFGGVMDKLALLHVEVYTYTILNQSIAALMTFLSTFFIFRDTKIYLFKKYFKQVSLIGLIQGVGWSCAMFAIVSSGNPGYAIALINTHAIITSLYGVFVLGEKITKRKIFVFCFMILALVAFAFA